MHKILFYKRNTPLIVLCIVCVGLFFMNDDMFFALRYQHDLFVTSEYMRLLTGHFLHLSVAHLLLNLFGLTLMWLLFARALLISEWFFLIVASALITSLCLYFFSPHVGWYVGLSGLLHAVFVAGLLLEHELSRAVKCVAAFVLAFKLVWEQLSDSIFESQSLFDGVIIVDAHLYGATAGLIVGVTLLLLKSRRKKL